MIDFSILAGFNWEHKDVAGEVLYDFLLLHTSDDAQQFVEMQDESCPEAWRKLSIRFDPLGSRAYSTR